MIFSSKNYSHEPKKCELRKVLPSKFIICDGQKVVLKVAEKIWPTPYVQWQIYTHKGWSDLRNNGPCLIFTADKCQNGNLYRAIVDTKCKCYITNTLQLIVDFIQIIQNPIDQTVLTDQTATFTVKAVSNSELYIQWQSSSDDGTTWIDLLGETSEILEITATALNTQISYRAKLTNACETIFSNSAILNTALIMFDFTQTDGGFTADQSSNPWMYNPGIGWFVNGTSTDDITSTLESGSITIPNDMNLFPIITHQYNFNNGNPQEEAPDGGYNLIVTETEFPIEYPDYSEQVITPLVNRGWTGESSGEVISKGIPMMVSSGEIKVNYKAGWDSQEPRSDPNWEIRAYDLVMDKF